MGYRTYVFGFPLNLMQGRSLIAWVTFHGLALNVTSDLAYFRRINPCGFEASVMTSMAAELDAPVDVAEVRGVLAGELGQVLGRSAGQARQASGT